MVAASHTRRVSGVGLDWGLQNTAAQLLRFGALDEFGSQIAAKTLLTNSEDSKRVSEASIIGSRIEIENILSNVGLESMFSVIAAEHIRVDQK